MNLLTLHRRIYSDRSTIGELSIDGQKVCDSIELSCRRGDEKNLLAIVPGRYQLLLSLSPRFRIVTPELLKVPRLTGGYRAGIRIHPANLASQLDGCIAPGVYDPMTPDFVGHSKKNFDLLMDRLEARPGPWEIHVEGGRSFDKAVA